MEYILNEITKKAQYCLNCKNKPCVTGCPLGNDIPEFINKIKNNEYNEAFDILSKTTVFEPICGRICPHKSQCEGKCVRGIKGESVKIGELESFIGDYIISNGNTKKNELINNKQIAIIGAGPAGLASAYYLSNKGYKINLYEKHSKLGGLLRYGIPEFRLSKELLDTWLNVFILNENISVKTNITLGKDITLDEIKKQNDAVILAFGANISNKMGIDGEEKSNVFGGNELLEYADMPQFENKRVAVIGGGNVAIDVARTVKRLNPNSINVIYRRDEQQMPAEKKEIEDAKKEGINFLFKTNIIKILENKIECIKTELVKKPDESREYPINIENSNFYLDMDYVIMALGSSADKVIISKLGLETNKYGYIKIDENYLTSDNKVYAIGDLAGMKQTVAWAARSGFECAKIIENKIIHTL